MTSESGALEFEVLGRLRVYRDGTEIELPANRQREILLRLLLNRGLPVSLDILTDTLWGSTNGPAKPEGALRTHMSGLRDRLDPERTGLIQTEGDSYRLVVPSASVDSERFLQAVEEARDALDDSPDRSLRLARDALSLWRGTPFLEVDHIDFSAERTRLQEGRISAGEINAEALVQLGRNDEAISDLQAFVDEYPLNERFRYWMMMALYRQDRSADALREYQKTREILGEVLGIEPAARLSELEDQILLNDPALASPTKNGEQAQLSTPSEVAIPTRSQRRITELLVRLSDGERWQAELAERYSLLEAEFTEIVGSVVADHGGSRFQHWGDRVLAVFGDRPGIEGNADLACRAALAIHEAFSDRDADFVRDFGAPVRTQAFVHRGLVEIDAPQGRLEDVRGTLPTEIGAMEQRSESKPGVTVISASTLGLVRESFNTTPLDPIAHGGRRLEIHRIDDRKTSRLSDLRVELIGRSRELDLLRRHWEAASAGHATVVYVTGEAGIGKSRLVEELRSDVEANGGLWLSGSASVIRTDSPFYLFEDLLEVHLRSRGVDPGDLKQAAGVTGIDQEWLEPLLLGSGVVPKANPAEARRHVMEELTSWIERSAAEQPVTLLLEDLHWADSSSVELTHKIAEVEDALPLLIVATHRPVNDDMPIGVIGLPRGFSIDLDPLPAGSVNELAEAVARRFDIASLPDDLSRCVGNPLFVQEIVRAEWPNLPDEIYDVPDMIYEVLVARLDACGPAKHAAEAASVLGTSFPNQMLGSLEPGQPMKDWTNVLLAEGVFEPVEGAHGTVTRFSHTLIQEVAYEILDSKRKAALHRVAAENLPPEAATRSPEVLARHLEAVWRFSTRRLEEDLVLAVEAWLAAGRAASSKSAYQEALNYYDKKAAVLMPFVNDTDRRHELEYELHVARATPLTALHGYAADEVDEAYNGALRLASVLGREEEIFTELRGKAAVHLLRADLAGASEYGTRAARIADETADPAKLAEAHAWLGTIQFFRGHTDEAEGHFDDVAQHYDPEWHRAHGPQIELDPLTLARSHRAWLLQQIGEPERALEMAQQATEDSKKLQHPLSLTHSLLYEAGLRVFRDEPREAWETSNEQVAIAEHRLFPHYLYYGQLIGLYAQARLGEAKSLDAVVDAMDEALAKRNQETRALLAKPFQLWLIGQVELMRGNEAGAGARLEQARKVALSTGEVWFLDKIEVSLDEG